MRPIHLLLVEDDPDSAEAIRALLEMQGVTVEWAATAGEVLSLYEANPQHAVDLIVLDLMLPDLDGVELIHRLAQRVPLPPIVIHSAMAVHEVEGAARQVGAVAVLRKPTDWSKLREILEQATAVVRQRE